jgi:hypothetical protein
MRLGGANQRNAGRRRHSGELADALKGPVAR